MLVTTAVGIRFMVLFVSHSVLNIPDEQSYTADEVIVEEEEEIQNGG